MTETTNACNSVKVWIEGVPIKRIVGSSDITILCRTAFQEIAMFAFQKSSSSHLIGQLIFMYGHQVDGKIDLQLEVMCGRIW